ncbi:MAG: Glu-tRNA(Gln) amidotransferase subunit GatE [Gemmatimonadota bacterium]|jgi:glutamyl-tRNA(Gln) amidotransferase subunit E
MTAAAHPQQYAVRPPPELNPRADPVLDFPDRPLEAMTAADYDALGFLSGLEVHQQLLTRSKLFCRCPAGRTATRVDAEVLRHMRPTLSEMGEYDGTALMEFKTRKEIVYLLERGSVCTYEMDDTPPFPIDAEAVRIALEVAALADLQLVSELHVMRKQYLDGSIPTGFQRTAMVGLDGRIPFREPGLGVDRELGIRQLSLEEDACREVSDVGHRIVFRTDRLGMPLTELVTEPELRTPLELRAAARLLTRLARATEKVRRGPGAVRQDVNVSVAGGRRVEIKGVQGHRRLPLLVHTEAFRQLDLLRLREELRRRGGSPEALAVPGDGASALLDSGLVLDAGRTLRASMYTPLARALDRGESALAVRLPGFAGVLGRPLQPGCTFADELAERVRVIACPVHRTFLTHTDRPEALGEAHWRELRRAIGADSDDALVLVWAPEEDARTAAREVLVRAREAFQGIPAETRQARGDGTTGFERILPGPDRMYPDTDTPPLPIEDTLVKEVRLGLAEPPWARERRYESLGLAADAARRLAAAPWADLFDAVAPAAGGPAIGLSAALEQRVPFHARSRARADLEAIVPPADRLVPLVRALEEGTLRPDALIPALDEVLRDTGREGVDVLEAYRPRDHDAERLRRRVDEALARIERVRSDDPAARLRWAMGEVMRPLRGRVDPRLARKRLQEALGAEVTA